ncbi:MAG: alpha/beta hydrolase [Streptosporangiaceae bacterium]
MVPTPLGEKVALISHPPPGDGNGKWAVFLYGNDMTLARTLDVRLALAGQNAGSVCVDYLGFGLSTGEPSEKGCRRAAEAALAFLRDEHAVRSSDVTVIGWSLGSAVAVDLAVRQRLGSLVLLSPMTSILGVLLDQLGIRSPGASSAGPFNSAGKIARAGCDVLIISGLYDRICPPYMAADLARRLGRSKVENLTLPGVGHNDLLRRGPAFWDLVGNFLHRAPAQ